MDQRSIVGMRFCWELQPWQIKREQVQKADIILTPRVERRRRVQLSR